MNDKLKIFFDNKEELASGAVFGGALFPFIGWWAVPTSLATATLWRLGGSFEKEFRRTGVAGLVTLILVITPWWHFLITYLACWLSLHAGYGIPDDTDKGSVFGRFWYRLLYYRFPGNHKTTLMFIDFLTRMTVALLYVLALGTGTGFTFHWALTAAIITFGYPLTVILVE